MPFREKAKNLFKSKSRNDSLSKTSTNGSASASNHDVYKPGEPMPPPKYRRPPQKEHKDKLESFSFSDAWRKRSFQSTHSPGGTRAPSRRTSRVSFGARKSIGRRSISGGSVTSGGTDMSGSKGKDSLGGGGVAVRLPVEPEQEGDDDVANVGLSRAQSKENKPFPQRPDTAEREQTNGLQKTRSTAHDHQPFSEQDLAKALDRSHLQVPAR